MASKGWTAYLKPPRKIDLYTEVPPRWRQPLRTSPPHAMAVFVGSVTPFAEQPVNAVGLPRPADLPPAGPSHPAHASLWYPTAGYGGHEA